MSDKFLKFEQYLQRKFTREHAHKGSDQGAVFLHVFNYQYRIWVLPFVVWEAMEKWT